MEKGLLSNAKDFISAGGPNIRTLMKNNLNVSCLRTNDLLRKEQWTDLDATLVEIARDRLIGINDLRSRGLVRNLGGLGVLLTQYEQLSDMTAANVDYAGVTEGEKDGVTFTLVSVPVPIIHKDFSINIRRQQASERGPGQPIDKTQVEVATTKVVEGMEDLLFNGTSIGALDGNTLYGYTTQTSANTEAGSDWGTVTNPEIDVIDAIDELEQDNYFGPFVMYVAKTQFGQLRQFHTDGSGETVFRRLGTIPGIDSIKPGDRLTAGNAVLVSMRRDVVELAIGQDMTVVEWETKGGFTANFKVLTAIAPIIKADKNGGSGVCTLTGI